MELYRKPIEAVAKVMLKDPTLGRRPEYSRNTELIFNRIKSVLCKKDCDRFDVRKAAFDEIENAILGGALEVGFLRQLQEAIRDDVMNLLDNEWTSEKVEKALTPLVNNQPQLVITGSWRNRDPLVGQDSWFVTVSYEHGTRNVNTLLRRSNYPSDDKALKEVFLQMIDKERIYYEDKYTFSGTYSENPGLAMDYDYIEVVTDPATTDQITIPRIASIDLPESWEWSAVATWSRYLRNKKEGPLPTDKPLLTLSLSYSDVKNDPNRQDRWVARLSYIMALSNSISLPFTLSWASHPELVGDVDERWGAHAGLSYKFVKKK
jgi:hypothetical protein